MFLEKCRKLAQTRLPEPAGRLFSELTGWRLRIAWAPRPPLSWDAVSPFCCGAACQGAGNATEPRAGCARYARRQLASALQSGPRGRSFTCPFGVRNFCLPLVIGSVCVGVVFFQLLTRPREGAAAAKPKMGRGGAKTKRRSGLLDRQFSRARRLVQLIVHDTVESVLAEAHQIHADRLTQNVAAHERVERALRAALRKALPFVELRPAGVEMHCHSERLVQRMLDYIHAGYGQPIHLLGLLQKRSA